MPLGKQAKTLSRQQILAVQAYLSSTRHPVRNRLIFLFSIRVGLRAKEIAGLTWSMVLTSDGSIADDLCVLDQASKGRSGRTVPMCRELKAALEAWRQLRANALPHVSTPERFCSSGPEQKYIGDASNKASDIGGLIAFRGSFLRGYVRC